MTQATGFRSETEALKDLEEKLYGFEVEDRVRQLPDEEKHAFVAARLALTGTLDRLEAERLEDIERQLAGDSRNLSAGIRELDGALGRLDQAVHWAGQINGVLGFLQKIVPVLAG